MCEISYFMKPLEISVNSCSYCFTWGLRKITEIPRHFTKSLKISTPFFTILLILLRPSSVNCCSMRAINISCRKKNTTILLTLWNPLLQMICRKAKTSTTYYPRKLCCVPLCLSRRLRYT